MVATGAGKEGGGGGDDAWFLAEPPSSKRRGLDLVEVLAIVLEKEILRLTIYGLTFL